MKVKPKFIYFDLDDTLLDHKSAEKSALNDIHEHFDCFRDTDVADLIDTYHKVNSRQWKLYGEGEIAREQLQRNRFEETLEKLGLDGSRYEEIGTAYMGFYRNHWEWVQGAEKAFHSIRKDFETGILTNGFSETQKAKFEQFNLYSHASQLVISEDVGHLKPDPRIFEYATELTGYDASDILYIGDSYNSDVLGGTSYGWKVAWYTSNGVEEEHDKADIVFNTFNDLYRYLEV
ncbi:HAD-IA family hydrolase [Balneolaceae bacterium YR4-1]|uniref:HAD-IA family hydrolase n=1 Tax=Halalkalibaculum roseum TaxID=2709311 RepID=A0A6M1T2P1_9BACT|nr:HAD-IA family hydrolase [Halalkalibaculum roseum]NGP77037.1 HAD-IA family hydrolase [Halalkalibaculum roseum]